jgi:hypothetical protein
LTFARKAPNSHWQPLALYVTLVGAEICSCRASARLRKSFVFSV